MRFHPYRWAAGPWGLRTPLRQTGGSYQRPAGIPPQEGDLSPTTFSTLDTDHLRFYFFLLYDCFPSQDVTRIEHATTCWPYKNWRENAGNAEQEDPGCS